MSVPAAADATASAAPAAASTSDHAQALDVLTRATLSSEEFDQRYAPILRICQRNGECPFEWTAVRHLLALRLQQVYADYRRSDAADAPSELSTFCQECRSHVLRAAQAGADATEKAIAHTHCKHSAVDEETPDVRYQRMLQLLMDFYKPPFTFQRMCDLLLEPRVYHKSTNKFLLAFSKLVCGITSDVLEDEFNVNEQKDAILGLTPVQFVTREEDEFDLGASNMVQAVATHAVLPPQHHRVGMNAAEIAQARAAEAQAKLALAQRQPGISQSASPAGELQQAGDEDGNAAMGDA